MRELTFAPVDPKKGLVRERELTDLIDMSGELKSRLDPPQRLVREAAQLQYGFSVEVNFELIGSANNSKIGVSISHFRPLTRD